MTRVIDAKTSIGSMRDAGYKNQAYALAELMDNSIQAGASIVELITFSKKGTSGRQNISSIAVFDNGSGMPPELLRKSLSFGQGNNREDLGGMGKFGFGLPSASISQCRHVDIWSWTEKSECHKTFIDIDDILNGDNEDVPEPIQESLPEYIQNAIGDIIPPSGTVVLWSNIDRSTWKTAKTLSKHVELEIGRMYRYFIAGEKVVIRFKPFFQEGSLCSKDANPICFKACDPLGLMTNTALPELPPPFKGEPFFQYLKKIDDSSEKPLKIKDKDGNEHIVELHLTIARQAIIDAILQDERSRGSNKSSGSTDWGKYLKKNQGFSIVRAGRELVLRNNILSKDEKWRHIGMELQFPPALDEVFGVLNNKQDAVNINLLSPSEDAENEGFDNPLAYKQSLEENSPILELYKLSERIDDLIECAQSELKSLTVVQPKNKPEPNNDGDDGGISLPPTPAIPGSPELDPIPNYDDLVKALVEQGIQESTALVIARKVTDEQSRYIVREDDLETDAFFEVRTAQGITLIIINKNHIFYRDVIQKCNETQKVLIELTIGSFGYMEHDSRDSPMRKGEYQRTRRNWGAYLANVLEAASSE